MQGPAAQPSRHPRGRMPGVPGRFGLIGRILGDGENPLRWGVTLARVSGIRIRVHWLFIVFILTQIIFTLPRHQTGVGFVLPLLAALFVLVLLHEFAHCIACRRVGGEADEIVLWPLGGLASCRPPHHWKPELITTLAGPMVNLALLPVFAGLLIGVGGSWRAAWPNPFDPGASILQLEIAHGSMPAWLIALWSLNLANLVLLAFNLLVPMYPMDAGRVLQALLWRRLGYHRALWITVHAGLAAAVLLALTGMVLADGKMLVAIGVFGGIICWMERQRIQFLAGVDPVPPSIAQAPEPARPARQHPGAAAPRTAAHPADPSPEPEDAAEVDRILDKISRSGMQALSAQEKRVLKRATERSRETESPGTKSDQ